MERLFRSLKCEWIPDGGDGLLSEAGRDIGKYLMRYYNWQRPHQYNGGLAPAAAEEKPNLLSGISDHYNTNFLHYHERLLSSRHFSFPNILVVAKV